MTLPLQLQHIFKQKQRSYKMVLVLCMLDEWEESQTKVASLASILRRFRDFFLEREARGLIVDSPPSHFGNRWEGLSDGQFRAIMKNPIEALSEVLDVDQERSTITFKNEILHQLDSESLKELREYAMTELERYFSSLQRPLSLQKHLTEIVNSYLKAKTEPITNHPMGYLFRNTIPQVLSKLPFISDQYKIQGSVGQGNWAAVPWIAIMNKQITTTTRQGEYIVYLFAEDMSAIYLSLAQGVTIPMDRLKKKARLYLTDMVQKMREVLPLHGMHKDENFHLTSRDLGKAYQVSSVAYLRYDRDHIPDDEQLLSDLKNMMDNYQQFVELKTAQPEIFPSLDSYMDKPSHENVQPGNDDIQDVMVVDHEREQTSVQLTVSEHLQAIKTYIARKGFLYPSKLIDNFYLSLKTKPFVILAGISGTGKTKLVKLFAEALGATEQNGQFNLIPVRPDWSDPSDLLGYRSLDQQFQPGRLTQVLLEASKPQNRQKPYFICLDEMNLARVEHYFSDILSILETQRWEHGQLITDPILHNYVFNQHEHKLFGTLTIPDNVYFIGTVNMDETTHPFSKKVLDRANTIEFNYINLEQLPDGAFTPTVGAVPVPALNDFLRTEYVSLIDAYPEHEELIQQTTHKLVDINTILEEVHSQIGFRVRDAICFYMIYNHRFGLLEPNEAFDQQLLQKILPRIQGSSQSVKRVLIELMFLATGEKKDMDEMLDDASELYKPWKTTGQGPNAVYPQSARKVAYMLRRLEEDGFTSFWLA